MRLLLMLLPLFLLGGCNLFQPKSVPVSAPETLTAKALMYNAENELIGEVAFQENEKGVELSAILNSLPPGEHGIHIHEVGKCERATFETAGAHYNPEKKQHGVENPLGPHVGDLPNLTVDESGEVHLNVLAPQFTLKKGEAHSLFDADGSSVIIHAKEDDYKTDPSGNSGARIACGVIQ